MEYTFEDWMNGNPEPRSPFWKLDLDNNKLNPVYRQIAEAKKNTFDWSLDGIIHLGKSNFLDKMNGLTQRRKKAITEKMIVDSKKYFEGYEINQLIYQQHPKKYDGIDGNKYREVKKAYEDFQDGINLGFKYLRNDFFEGVLHFELNEFYQDFLQNDCKNLEPIIPENHGKGETIAVKFKLLDNFFQGNEEFKKLLVKDQQKLLGYILGCHYDTAKHVKNFSNKGNPDGKYITQDSIDRFNDLYIKIKKGDLL